MQFTILSLVFSIIGTTKKNTLQKKGLNKKKLRKDFIKVITSVGVAEIIYFSSRWFLHYHFLSIGQEPYLASIISHVIAATLFVLSVNAGVYFTKLYKKDSNNL